ncbi:MAG: hypothetical protein F6J90_01340 [Moorea sp. SIOASIH]|nr:hypothetical protein [Moorena sp. SIOASIH]
MPIPQRARCPFHGSLCFRIVTEEGYSNYHTHQVHRIFVHSPPSLAPGLQLHKSYTYSLLPAPCSLKPKDLYLTQLITAIIKIRSNAVP